MVLCKGKSREPPGQSIEVRTTSNTHVLEVCYTILMALDWSQKRRLYFGIVWFLIILAIAGVFMIPYFTKDPTCFDGKENGEEEGVDCGGICQIVCMETIKPPILLWSRAFPVTRGIYNVVAYVENENTNLGVEEALYSFRLYDANNIIIAERKGRTFIGPGERLAIFEPRISTGERVPRRTFFEFLSFSEWKRTENIQRPPIFVRDQKLSNDEQNTRLFANLENGTIVPIADIDAIAILYDAQGNAIAVSATKVDLLPSESSREVVFTWPKLSLQDIVNTEIIPRINLLEFTF